MFDNTQFFFPHHESSLDWVFSAHELEQSRQNFAGPLTFVLRLLLVYVLLELLTHRTESQDSAVINHFDLERVRVLGHFE